MEILLREDVPKLGKMGEVVEVADGYARNYLLPKQIAVPATEENRRQIGKKVAAREEREEAELDRVQVLATRLDGFLCYVPERATEDGRLYGSVNAERIAQALRRSGFEGIRPSSVGLDEPIEETGDYDIEVMLHPEVRVHVTVRVTPEGGEGEEE